MTLEGLNNTCSAGVLQMKKIVCSAIHGIRIYLQGVAGGAGHMLFTVLGRTVS